MHDKAESVLAGCDLPERVYPATAIRLHEAEAAADCGIAMYQLMERAGSAVFGCLQAMQPQPGRLLVLAGKGNNGGDGYVLARLALAAGWQVRMAHVGQADGLTGDAARAQQAWRDCGGEIIPAEALTAADLETDVIADGLLGTGLSGEVRAPFDTLIRQINQARADNGVQVLAIDIPSGLCADTGRRLGSAVIADATVSFVGLKPGLLTGSAADHVGKLFFTDLGIGEAFARRVPTSLQRCDYSALRHWLGPRARQSYKGDFGRVLCIGGSAHMPGAIRLAGEACLRTGAGLVRLAVHPDHGAELIAGRPELMLTSHLDEALGWAGVLALGPGLGRDSWGETCFNAAYRQPLPQVVDADGLFWLARVAASERMHTQRIVTPHAGEAARLLDVEVAVIEADRLKAAADIAARYGGVCVLKGPGTVIADAQRSWIAEPGNPGMASGGMGDVLSGIISGLLAQGLPLFEAAALGVCLHCQAADRAVGAAGLERGLLASDLMPHIRKLVNPTHVAL